MPDYGFHLLMVETIAVHRPDPFREVKYPLCGKGRGLDKLFILPVAAGGGYFAYVDLRVEVGGKWLTMTACIGVNDIYLFNHIQIFLRCQCGVDVGYARIKTGA